jgi:CRISPR/Cas system-associated exonuclease Cas4 (RecB family)
MIERDREGRLRIVDHKTGRRPKKPPQAIGAGEALQPMLYALAAEAALGETPVEAVLSYATLRENFEEYPVPVNLETRSQIALVLRTVDDWISRGFLPAAPRAEACAHCDYRPVCGPYEEMRVKGKLQPAIQGLVEIRRRP